MSLKRLDLCSLAFKVSTGDVTMIAKRQLKAADDKKLEVAVM